MAIVQGEDGYLTFNIPKDVNSPDISLPLLSDYVNFLNDSELANCLINRQGMVTASDILGVFIETAPKKFGIITGSEFNPIIYRGQNNDYPFMPASQRYELFDGNERIRHSIDWIKKNEFINLLKTTPYYTKSCSFKVLDSNFDIDMEAIAAQYDFVTNYIDITRDLMVALFFAYTYFDMEKKQILPVENFEYFSPTLYIGSIKDLYMSAPKAVSKMGFEPDLRAKLQQAMSIDVSENKELIKGLFKKVDLPKNPVIAKYVFKQFEEGNLLYPADYVSRCASQIRSHKTLQDDLVRKYCVETKTDEVWLRGEYKKLGYTIITQPWDIPEQAKLMINKEIDEFILPYLESGFIFRGMKKTN